MVHFPDPFKFTVWWINVLLNCSNWEMFYYDLKFSKGFWTLCWLNILMSLLELVLCLCWKLSFWKLNSFFSVIAFQMLTLPYENNIKSELKCFWNSENKWLWYIQTVASVSHEWSDAWNHVGSHFVSNVSGFIDFYIDSFISQFPFTGSHYGSARPQKPG